MLLFFKLERFVHKTTFNFPSFNKINDFVTSQYAFPIFYLLYLQSWTKYMRQTQWSRFASLEVKRKFGKVSRSLDQMRMGWIRHNLFAKQKMLTKKNIWQGIPSSIICSVLLVFIITTTILSNSIMK